MCRHDLKAIFLSEVKMIKVQTTPCARNGRGACWWHSTAVRAWGSTCVSFLWLHCVSKKPCDPMDFNSSPTLIPQLPESCQEFIGSLRGWVFPLSLGSDRVVLPTLTTLPASLPLQRCHSISLIFKDDAPTSYLGCSLSSVRI